MSVNLILLNLWSVVGIRRSTLDLKDPGSLY